MIIYFVRHGESEGNIGGFHQTPDTPLTEIGLSQARLLAHRFKKIEVDRLVASDYLRARQTAGEIAKTTGLKIELDKNLRERRNPTELNLKEHMGADSNRIRAEMEKERFNANWHFNDEENYFDLLERAKQFVRSLDADSGEKIVAVTHGIFLRTVSAVLIFGINITIERYLEWIWVPVFKNTGITKFEFENIRPGEKGWRLVNLNDVAHLE